MSQGLTISRETFESLSEDPSKQNLILFDLVKGTYDCSCRLDSKIDEKNKVQDDEIKIHGHQIEQIHVKMASRKKYELGLASALGLVGGFLAHFTEWAVKGGR